MYRCIALVLLFMVSVALPGARGVEPEVAAISFDSRCSEATNYPSWITTVEQQDGQFFDDPPCWKADATLLVGVGRVSIVIDRTKVNEDLALQIVYEDNQDADLVVQLFDSKNQALALDLFSNVLAVGREARTDTFIVPLRSHPTATRITLRRIRGAVKVFGVALYPVVGVAQADNETLEALAKLLGDKISPGSSLAKRLAQLVKERAGTNNARSGGKLNKTPVGTTAALERPNPDSATDWVVLPFPANCDWPGPKGLSAELGGNDFLLRGQPVRTRRSFSVPVRITFDFVLEQRLANDGAIELLFEPPDVPDTLQADRNVTVLLCYRNPGAYSGTDGIAVHELLSFGERFHPNGRVIWPERPFHLNAGETYHVSLLATTDGMQWTVNGQMYDLTGVKVPFDRFRIMLFGWQPTNRWHVRNISIR
jgi:hypothetical protein